MSTKLSARRRSSEALLAGYALPDSRHWVSRHSPSGSTNSSVVVIRFTRRSSQKSSDKSRSRASNSCLATASGCSCPLVFCRECGQEYYSVRMTTDQEAGVARLHPQGSERSPGGSRRRSGFPPRERRQPWPTDPDARPEQTSRRLARRASRHDARAVVAAAKNFLGPVRIAPDARESETGFDCHFLPAPFRFCLQCRRFLWFPASFRFRKARHAQLGRPKHRDHRSLADHHPRASACPGAPAGRAKTPELHRQPARRQPAGRPLQ